MRNLKKILALVLALVMSLSLVTTAGAFSDDGDINANYQDAIDVLSGLDVFKGYSDGSFQPKGSITRAEVAAIIYRIDTGDVTDTQASIYSTWGKFKDVQDGAWYAGYVNYCANAEYIKGRGNGIFDPQATVTGYEALAMILRAVGYDKNGEFTGSNWQVRTASIGRERGILKNVTEGLLGQSASRELVAEILFRSIVIPKVEFSANSLSYKLKGAKDTLGYENFKLEEITGVVLANEKADLEGPSPLIDGKVRMSVDGETYVLNDDNDDASGFNALGESYHAYIIDAAKTSTKVLKMAKSDDSKSFETWEDKDIGDNKKFLDVTGFQNTGVRLVNYGASSTSGSNKSDWRIRYVIERDVLVTLAADGSLAVTREEWVALSKLAKQTIYTYNDKTSAYTINNGYTLEKLDAPVTDKDGKVIYNAQLVYNKTLAPGDEITAFDLSTIEEIFATADRIGNSTSSRYIWGEVYVGTSSLKDVSDSMSYNEFVKQYINNGVTTGLMSFTKNDRGNYLKVIDNDNDGYADYALKTVYTMAQVVRAKDGEYGLDVGEANLDDTHVDFGHKDAGINDCVKKENIKTEDGTLALGDIVYYAMIDGQGWAYKAETANVKVNTVNRADRKITTDDGTEYLESDVHGVHVVSKDYTCGVTNMNGYSTYTVYLDGAGNVALFEDANSGDFKLIVDGWYNNLKNGVEYAVWTYNDETGRQEVRDVTRGGDLFIDGRLQDVLNNGWRALRPLGGTNGDLNYSGNANTPATVTAGKQVKTTVATLTADGVLQPADYYAVYRSNIYGDDNNVRSIAMIDVSGNAVPNSSALYQGTLYTTPNYATVAYSNGGTINGVEVRALASTVYYFVYPDSKSESGFSVERYVGYANVPKVAESEIEDVYAVGTLRDRDSTLGRNNYYTANVIVVEMNDKSKFGEQVFIYNMPEAGSSVAIETVDVIRENGEKDTIKVDFEASEIRGYHQALEANGLRWTNWGPGLYYLYTTNTEGLYRVTRMLPADIAANNYATGYVSTSGGTVRDNYVELYKLDNGLVAYDRDEWAITNNNVYRMSWNKRGLVDGFAQYNVNEGNIDRFLGERKEATSNPDHYWGDPDNCGTASWNWNRVLVHYDSNGAAKYVVSFNDADQGNTNALPSLSYQVWNGCLPSSSVWNRTAAGSKELDRAVALRYAKFMNGAKGDRYMTAVGFGKYTSTVLADMAQTLWNARNISDGKGSEVYNICAALDSTLSWDNTQGGSTTAEDVKKALDAAKEAVTSGNADKLNSALAALNALKDRDDLTPAQKDDIAAQLKAVNDKIAELKGNVNVTFTTPVDGSAVVKIDGKTVENAEVKKGDTVKFTVEAVGSFVIDEVKNGTDVLTADANGEYSVTVNESIEITVTTRTKTPGKVTVTVKSDNAAQTEVKFDGVAAEDGSKVFDENAGEVKVTITAKTGYKIKSVKNGETVLDGVNGVYTVDVKTEDITLNVVVEADNTNTTVAEGTPIKVTVKYVDVKGQDAGVKSRTVEMLTTAGSKVTFDARKISQTEWFGVDTVKVTMPDGTEVAKNADGDWEISVSQSDADNGIEITSTLASNWTSGGTSRRARAAAANGTEYVGKGYAPDGLKIVKDGLKVSPNSKGFEIVSVTYDAKAGENTECIVTIKVTDETVFDDEIIFIGVKYYSAIDGGEDIAPVEDTTITFDGLNKGVPSVTTEDGNVVTTTEYTSDDGSLTIRKVTTSESDSAETIIETVFNVTAAGEVDVEKDKADETVVAESKLEAAADETIVTVNQFTVSGPEGEKPVVALDPEYDPNEYDVVVMENTAARSSSFWTITILMKVKTANAAVTAEVSFSVTFEEVKPPVEQGELVVEAVEDLYKIDFGTDYTVKYAHELQTAVKAPASGTENDTYVAEGVSNYIKKWDVFGDTDGTGYFLVLKLSYPEKVGTDISIKSKDMDGKPSGGWKKLDNDGVVVWKMSEDTTTKTIKPISVKVSGVKVENEDRIFTIDLNNVQRGAADHKLAVTPAAENENLWTWGGEGANKDNYVTPKDLQEITVDDTGLNVSGKAFPITNWTSFGTKGNGTHWYVALKLNYPGADTAGDILYESEDGVVGENGVSGADNHYRKAQNGDVLVWQIDGKTEEPVEFIVEGKKFYVDMDGIELTTGKMDLNIKAVEQDKKVLGKLTSDVQSGTTTVTPVGEREFDVSGTLYYVSNWTDWSTDSNYKDGYYLNLRVFPEGVDNWSDVKVGTVDSPSKPFVEEENKDDSNILSKRIDPKKDDFGISVGGIVYTVHVKNLVLEDPMNIKPTEGEYAQGTSTWKYNNADDLQSITVTRGTVETGDSDTFYVDGFVYYAENFNPGFSTNDNGTDLSDGYYLVLDFENVEGGKVKVKGQYPAPTGNDTQELTKENNTVVRRVFVRSGQPQNMTIEGFGKTFTLDLSKLKLASGVKLSVPTESTFKFTESAEKEIAISDVQKTLTVEEKADKSGWNIGGTLVLVDPKLDGYTSDDNIKQKGWYVVLKQSANGIYHWDTMNVSYDNTGVEESGLIVIQVAQEDGIVKSNTIWTKDERQYTVDFNFTLLGKDGKVVNPESGISSQMMEPTFGESEYDYVPQTYYEENNNEWGM